jgi:peptidoglycan/xylan/chitin deacetylase (PgdA/CDA1 family)
MVRTIAARGHEIASHGMTHALVDRLSRRDFLASAIDSRRFIEDTVGGPVRGYRSPSFAAVRIMSVAADVLAEAGYSYDSSAHAGRSMFGGTTAAPMRTRLPNGLLEFPVSSLYVGESGLSVGSSFYCRRLPPAVHRRLLARAARAAGGLHVYFHPFEITGDPGPCPSPLAHPSYFFYAFGMRRGAARVRRMVADRTYVPIGALAGA